MFTHTPPTTSPLSPAFITGKLCPHLPLTPNSSKPQTCPPSGTRYLQMGRRSAKIQGRKDAQTLKRTKVFARIGKMITMAAKTGGPDIVANKALADAINAAKAVSFPKDTMEKAIARATSADQADFKESSFEAYGHGGVAIYIDVLTDNSNRAAAGIRSAINKSKMKVASPGSVAFNFERMGVIRVNSDSVPDPDDLLMTAIDLGAEECDPDEADQSMYRILTTPAALNAATSGLSQAGYEVDLAQLEMVPKTWVAISEEDMERNRKGIEALEALEDVDGVYINAKVE